MGCVRFARLTNIPVCSETYRLSNMVLSVSGSTEGTKLINQTIFLAFF